MRDTQHHTHDVCSRLALCSPHVGNAKRPPLSLLLLCTASQTLSFIPLVVMCCCCRIYRPEKPEGQRFLVTGAKTRLARMYHATSILTAKGDIMIVSGGHRVVR